MSGPTRNARRAGYETSDFPPLKIVAWTAGLFLALAASLWLLGLFYRAVLDVPPTRHDRSPAETAHRSEIAIERSELEARTHRHLHTRGWVDRGEGIVRVPLDRARELMLREWESAGAGVTPEAEAVPRFDLNRPEEDTP